MVSHIKPQCWHCPYEYCWVSIIYSVEYPLYSPSQVWVKPLKKMLWSRSWDPIRFPTRIQVQRRTQVSGPGLGEPLTWDLDLTCVFVDPLIWDPTCPGVFLRPTREDFELMKVASEEGRKWNEKMHFENSDNDFKLEFRHDNTFVLNSIQTT
jgi:hypothetical protein